jgi:site-specific DNA recombinase
MMIRTYCRRSKNDEGKQMFSLDVQSAGCTELITRMGFTNEERHDYVDDGRAGDDFHTRAGLRGLVLDAQRGDLIVCRDQSRLGRDAIEVTLVIRDLVRDRGCRLYYYSSGHEVQFANAIDQATTFIQGTGHQMELEAIRSRTKEALRSRVREGRVAGGSCFGYTLERKSDGSGRKYTIAVVNESEAPTVRRIYKEYLLGRGLKQIAHQLNHEGVPPATAGRRGSGSWAPSLVRSILLNPRYRGFYIHGRIKKVRSGGGVNYVKADAKDVMTAEVPEWRIVDDATWFAVAEMFTKRGPNSSPRKSAKYPMTGLGQCKHCGGAIVSHRVRTFGGGSDRMMAYGCSKHRDRGTAVCPVTVYQDMAEVEGALIYQLRHLLTGSMLDLVIGKIRGEISAQIPQREAEIEALESQLATARSEQRRLAKAVALSDEIPELVTELQQRSARIHNLEAQLLSARRSPAELAALVDKVESAVRDDLQTLRNVLAEPADLGAVFRTMFPGGLTFSAARTPDGKRQIWEIEGEASFNALDALPLAVPVSFTLRPRRDSNPCYLRERRVS